MKNWSAVGRVHVSREYWTVVWCRERKKERGKECWRCESCCSCQLLVWETVQLDHGIHMAHPINGYWLSMLWNEDVGVGHGVSLSTLVASYNQKWMKNIKKIFKEHTFGPNNASNALFGPAWTLTSGGRGWGCGIPYVVVVGWDGLRWVGVVVGCARSSSRVVVSYNQVNEKIYKI